MADQGDSDNGSEFELSAAVLEKAGEHHVVLPCDVSQFGRFVSGLLGKPQQMQGQVEGAFSVGYQEITNIFHLVHTRVTSQNQGALTHLGITVYYSNGTSITHNDVEKFKNHHPTEKCHPIEVMLSFTYLLNFPANQSPEKQVIEVSVSSEPNERPERRRHYMEGLFEYVIHYTDRTWATDIAGLLKNHGESFVDKPTSLKAFLRMNHDDVLQGVVLLCLSFSLIYWAMLVSDRVSQFSGAESLSGGEVASLVSFVVSSGAVVGVLAFALKFLRRIAEFHLHLRRRAFIVLVEKDQKRKDRLSRKSARRWFLVFGTWLLSIFASVIANVINGFGLFS